MKKFKMLCAVAIAMSFSASAAAAPHITDEELPEGTFITVNGLDWTWASPASAINASRNVLVTPDFRPGWRFATLEEFARRPLASAFFGNGVNGSVIHSAPYWNSTLTTINSQNIQNGVDGFVNRTIVPNGSSTAFYEIWYVRGASVSSAVPEPATWAMLLLGFGFIGAAMRTAKRRQRIIVSYA